MLGKGFQFDKEKLNSRLVNILKIADVDKLTKILAMKGNLIANELMLAFAEESIAHRFTRVFPRCAKCNEVLRIKILYVFNNGECWKCQAPMKVAGFFYPAKNISNYGIFTEIDAKQANEIGANVKLQYSKTIGEKYFANTCQTCNAFIGQNFLFRDYIGCYSEDEQIEIVYCPFCEGHDEDDY